MRETATRKASESPANAKGEVVVYQPDETMRLDVRLDEETVWLTQAQIAELFGTRRPAVTKHLANIYRDGELDEKSTCSILEHMSGDGSRAYATKHYNLDAILSVGYRVNSRHATMFRRWATSVLREYLLHGVAADTRMGMLEDRVDRRLARQDRDIEELRERVDFVVRSALPAPEMVFCEGEFLSAHDAIRKIVRSARRRLVLVDNFIDERVLTLLAERRRGVSCRVYGRNAASRDVRLAYERFRQQYPDDSLCLVPWDKAHDRFIVCDDVAWLCWASVKDAGRRMFALVKMATSPDFILKDLPTPEEEGRRSGGNPNERRTLV